MDAAALEKLSHEELLDLATKLGLTGGGAAEDADSIVVTPDPGFVIKTFRAPDGNGATAAGSSKPVKLPPDKIFVNVCSSEAVATFRNIKRLKADSSGEEEGLHIPVSVGPLRDDVDKQGKECQVCDIIVHPDVIRDCERDGTGSFRHFVAELALQYVERKYHASVSHQYRLPAMRYKGEEIASQRMRKRAAVAGISDASGVSTTVSASPLNLLAQSGAISQAAVPYQPGLAAVRRAHAASGATITHHQHRPSSGSAMPMDIRVLNPDEGDTQRTLTRDLTAGEIGGAATGTIDSMLQGAPQTGASIITERTSTRLHKVKEKELPVLPLLLAVAARVPLATSTPYVSDAPTPTSHCYIPLQILVRQQQPAGADTLKVEALLQADSAPPVDTEPGSSSTASTLTPVVEGEGDGEGDGDDDEAGAAVGDDVTKGDMAHGYRPDVADADGVCVTVMCRPIVDHDGRRVSKRILPADVTSSLGGSLTVLHVAVAHFQPLEIQLPFPVQASVAVGTDGSSAFIPWLLNSDDGILQICLTRDPASLTLTALPTLPVNLHAMLSAPTPNTPLSSKHKEEETPVDTTAPQLLPKPLLLSMLRQYVEAGRGSCVPDVGSKPWLLAHALSLDTDTDTATSTRKPVTATLATQGRPIVPHTKSDELPEDRFLKQDALSLHFIRQREEDKAHRDSKAAESQAARAATTSVEPSLITDKQPAPSDMSSHKPGTIVSDSDAALPLSIDLSLYSPQADNTTTTTATSTSASSSTSTAPVSSTTASKDTGRRESAGSSLARASGESEAASSVLPSDSATTTATGAATSTAATPTAASVSPCKPSHESLGSAAAMQVFDLM